MGRFEGPTIDRPGAENPEKLPKTDRPREAASSKPREVTPADAKSREKFQFEEDKRTKPEAKELQRRMDKLGQDVLRYKMNRLGDPAVISVEAQQLVADMKRKGYGAVAEEWFERTKNY